MAILSLIPVQAFATRPSLNTPQEAEEEEGGEEEGGEEEGEEGAKEFVASLWDGGCTVSLNWQSK